MIVVDASALSELLLQTPAAPSIDARLAADPGPFFAPHLVDVEVTQVMRRLAFSGDIAAERGRQALATLADFPLERISHPSILARIWELRDNLSAYDASYVVLAEALGAPLVTCDERLARTVERASGIRAEVEGFPSSDKA